MIFCQNGAKKKTPVCACSREATDNEQDLTPIYPQIYGITQIFADHWFDLQP